jgi:hypothetical protein
MTNLPDWEPNTVKMIDDGTGRAAWWRIVNGKFEVCTRSSKRAHVKRQRVASEDEANKAVLLFMEN